MEKKLKCGEYVVFLSNYGARHYYNTRVTALQYDNIKGIGAKVRTQQCDARV